MGVFKGLAKGRLTCRRGLHCFGLACLFLFLTRYVHLLHQILQKAAETPDKLRHEHFYEDITRLSTFQGLPNSGDMTPQELKHGVPVSIPRQNTANGTLFHGGEFHRALGTKDMLIWPFPPIADIPYDKWSVDKPCTLIRMANFMGAKLPLTGAPLCQWLVQSIRMADGKFYAYGGEMALLYDVIVDPSRRQPGPRGGEKLEDVWGQAEEKEYIKMQKGYFRLNCSELPNVQFNGNSCLNHWVHSVECQHTTTATSINHPNSLVITNVTTPITHVTGLTLALQREEYVNIYFIMLSLYNAFLATLAFNTHPKNITILLVDAHPSASQDDVWTTLFGRLIRAGHLTSPTRFSALGWIPWTHNSPLRQLKAPRVNYLEEFRTFVLRGHQVDTTHTLNCSSLNFLFIWRHDYAAHPRNQNGRIQRKIANEAELLAEVQKVVGPNDKVEGRQLDLDPLQVQLQRMAETDVLVGMHGAGLIHILFVPRHACVLELYPAKFPHNHEPFRAIASWRGLGYWNWKNKNRSLEKGEGRTYVPVDVMVDLVNSARRRLCG